MITIYSKDGCPYCDRAKKLLEELVITHEVVHIDKDNDAREFLLAEGHKSVPQLYVGKTLLVKGGYDGLREMSAASINHEVRKIHES